jgi:osmotically-inducible protein OsmY
MEKNYALRRLINRTLKSTVVLNGMKGQIMVTTNRIPDFELKQRISNWRVISTDGAPLSVLPIAVGQKVFCSDEYAGSIISLLSDSEGWVDAIVVQIRGLWRHKVIVPFDWIEKITEEKVYLSIGKSELKKLTPYRSDAALTAAVNKALWDDVILRRTEHRQIHVKVKNSIVYLYGYVSLPSVKMRAERAALKTDSIWKVENLLTIDSELQIAVAQAIGKDPRTKKARIFTGSHNGFITLSGEASDLEARTAAQEKAVSVPEVRGVLNSIRVPGVDIKTEDQRALQPIIGAGIYATDILIGVVEKVVINPDNRLATAILANTVFPDPTQMGSNWLWNEHLYAERRIIIPIETVRHQSELAIFLTVKGAEAAAFETFDAESYSSPDESWQPPYPYKRADILIVRQPKPHDSVPDKESMPKLSSLIGG